MLEIGEDKLIRGLKEEVDMKAQIARLPRTSQVVDVLYNNKARKVGNPTILIDTCLSIIASYSELSSTKV